MTYKNFLHIDDDRDDCEFFMVALQTISNAAYTPINDPVSALRQLIGNEISPDVIFLDLNMPVMSGIEFLTQIKKVDTLKNIPVIIFSTSQFDEIKLEAKNNGAHDYISKPNDFNELKKILRQYIE